MPPPPPPPPPQPLWLSSTLESEDLFLSWPPVGPDSRFLFSFVPYSSVVGKTSFVSSVERFSPLSSVSSEAVVSRFLGVWVLFIFSKLKLRTYSILWQHDCARFAAVIILLTGAAELLVSVPKTYQSLSVVVQDRQWK